MAETGLWMSDAERERAYDVRQSIECRLGQREAAERLRIGIRRFRRLVRKAKTECDAGLVPRRRGRPSNNRMATDLRIRIAALLTDKYPDFGPAPAAEKLLQLDGIVVSAETIRQMQIGLGL